MTWPNTGHRWKKAGDAEKSLGAWWAGEGKGLNSSHLLSPLAEVGPAECLGQELGTLSLQDLRGEQAYGEL